MVASSSSSPDARMTVKRNGASTAPVVPDPMAPVAPAAPMAPRAPEAPRGASTWMVSPADASPPTSRRATAVPTCFWTKRRRGLAPNAGSYARSTIRSRAASEASRVMPASRAARSATSWRRRAAMARRWVGASFANITVSSRRFSSSGRKNACTSPITAAAASGEIPPSPPTLEAASDRRCLAPRLEVKIRSVLEKSTVRPCPSVNRPSSNT
mmetsp:Transcript_27723/g.65689  ORF Transcript_27723/g.65689 Transcript_27723/m.65689 type:complete len:213 (-) Transcript_27723:2050-2688(-)